MKIEAKDLRIGNWVESNSKKFAIKSFDITNVVKGFFCQGIPLTPEILEKAGFEYHYLSPSQHYFHSPMIVINTYKTKDAFYYESQLCDVELKFVNQIQNLYYCLTGQELNIEL